MSSSWSARIVVSVAVLSVSALGACGASPAKTPAVPPSASSSSGSPSPVATVGQVVDGQALADALSAAMEQAGSLHVEVASEKTAADIAFTAKGRNVRMSGGQGDDLLLIGDTAYMANDPGAAKPWQAIDLLDDSDMSGLIAGMMAAVSAGLDPRTILSAMGDANVTVTAVSANTVTYGITGKDESGTAVDGVLVVDHRSLPTSLELKGEDKVSVAYSLWGEVSPPIEAPASSEVETPQS